MSLINFYDWHLLLLSHNHLDLKFKIWKMVTTGKVLFSQSKIIFMSEKERIQFEQVLLFCGLNNVWDFNEVTIRM